ncbi:MAG: VCBS repeat-containing protein [Pirellulales bacterium]|nr:VCBS repeat-containing protein [Pirellulales bacterium]
MAIRFRFHRVPAVLAGAALAAVCALSAPAAETVAPAAETPGTVQFSKRCLMVSPNEGCAVADVNRDGKLDVVAGTHWYAGPDFVARPLREIRESGDFLANNGDHLYDVDGDGWLDVISGGWEQSEISWYKNPGAARLARGFKWQANLLRDTRAENEAFELRDFDGDGVPELFVSCWVKEDPLVVWKLAKTDDGKPTIERIVLGRESGGHGYAFGDVNGDGREDVLCETGWYERPEGDVLAATWKFHGETALPHPSCPFVVFDVNDDGRNDLVWGKAHDFGLYLWLQGEPKPDGTTTWTEHLIDESWSQAHCIVLADLDGDGGKELITGKRVRGHAGTDPGGKQPECLFYYTLDKPTATFTRHTISPPGGGVGTGMQICVADLNADGRPDIAVSGKTGTWVLINEGVAPGRAP